jgi:Ca2+-transporting ATPase
MREFYQKGVDEVFRELKTGQNGLSDSEAKKRLDKYGRNKLKEGKKISKLTIFLNQFKSFIIMILLIATVISFFIGEIVDGIVILVIVIFNAVFGFVQEFKAEKSIEALKKLTALKTIVIRNGKEREIPSEELVPGDLVMIDTGTKIPADVRLIEAIELGILESSLTGESTSVAKNVALLKGKVAIADQRDMAFSSTIVTRGKGKGVVVKTGMGSEIGKIAKMIQETEEGLTPLQIKLDVLGRNLGIATIIICVFIFVLNVVVNLKTVPSLITNVHHSFMIAIALAVAAIPEGLPAVVTISLALGIQRMVSKNALIRKMASVETLGSTNIICSDKTGTLTKNEMTVRKIFCSNKVVEATGKGYKPEGSFLFENKKFDAKEFRLLFEIGALCNNAKLVNQKNKWSIIGDPTEACLLVSARKAGLMEDKLNKDYARVKEIPFSSETKRMTTVHKVNGKEIAYVKGAPDIILKHCSKIYDKGKVRALTLNDKKAILKANDSFTSDALRVLGFAYKPVKGKDYEKGLIFVGLQGMIDPPRQEVKDSIKKCYEAGIRVVMITGDHKGTAVAVARELGIEGDAVAGKEFDALSDKEFRKLVNKISIYARVNPEHKIRIVNALKDKTHIVAMTGDGVNDAPALKKADIGIAMGIVGTDVAKEASDMVLTDDNFSSIVNAVEEGRGIYDNIKKFINYLLSSNFGEILIILVASLFGMPLPLTAIQILWLNLVTDGLPAIALGVDPIEKDIMKKKPRNPKEHIIDKRMIISITIMGILIATGALTLFKINIDNLVKAQTIAFTSMVVFEIVRLQMIRANYKIGIFSNKYLILAVLTSIGLQLAVIYTPLNKFFKTVPLSLMDWGYILGAALALVIVSRIIRVFFKMGQKKGSQADEMI